MIKIIDDFLPLGYINAIEELCYSNKMTWQYVSATVPAPSNQRNLWDKQFAHILFDNGAIISDHYSFFVPIIFQIEAALNIKIKSLERYKLNLTTTVPNETVTFSPHIDLGDKDRFYSAILYINDSDGDTIIYENKVDDRSFVEQESGYQNYLENRVANDTWKILKKVQFLKNRLVVFDGSHLHEGKLPVYHKDRIVLNAVFKLAS